MQHIDCVGKSCCIDDAVSAGVIPHTQIFNSFTDRGHGLEVNRRLSPLHIIQLIARIVASVLGKLSQALERVTQEFKRLRVFIILVWI